MFLYYVATHPIFMWFGMTLAVVGWVIVLGFLKEAFVSPSAYDKKAIQRAAHYGAYGTMMMFLGLVIGGIFVACYPDPRGNVILAVYFLVYLIMSSLVMVGGSRMKERQRMG